MNELLYLPVTDRNGNYNELGLLVSGQWLPLYTDCDSDVINCNFLEKLDDIDSIKVSLDSGTATFRKENSKYWIAYKKLKGKLNKAYIGLSEVFSAFAIANAVAMVNTPKAVTQNNDYVTDKPIIELAGKGKSDRHLQPSLITESESLAMAQAEIKALKSQNEILVDRIIRVTELYQEQWQKSSKLEDACEVKDKRIDELGYFVSATQDMIDSRDKELEACKIQRDKFGTALIDCESAIAELEERLSVGLISDSPIQTIIDKHRSLADGKTRQAHPRWNKLLDFIADIDKLC